MSEASSQSTETIYPARCKDRCSLGSGALKLINGVLARNCPGPALFKEDTATLIVESGEAKITLTPPSDRDRWACQNPRLVAEAREIVNRSLEDVIVESVRMEDQG